MSVVTTIGAWLVLGERLTLLQIMGGGLVLLAVYLTNFLGDKAIKTENIDNQGTKAAQRKHKET